MRLPWGTSLFSGKFLEGFMLLFSFDMAASDRSRIYKRDTGALFQCSPFKEDSKRNTDFSPQLYKSIVGYGMWKILIHMCSNEEMEMLYISERGGMEEDKNRHDLATLDMVNLRFLCFFRLLPPRNDF